MVTPGAAAAAFGHVATLWNPHPKGMKVVAQPTRRIPDGHMEMPGSAIRGNEDSAPDRRVLPVVAQVFHDPVLMDVPGGFGSRFQHLYDVIELCFHESPGATGLTLEPGRHER
jgi:hypothetical protein